MANLTKFSKSTSVASRRPPSRSCTNGGPYTGANTTWFVAYAPSNHPKIALAVFMEKSGGYGASVAGPVAQHIIGEYFGKKLPPIDPSTERPAKR